LISNSRRNEALEHGAHIQVENLRLSAQIPASSVMICIPIPFSAAVIGKQQHVI